MGSKYSNTGSTAGDVSSKYSEQPTTNDPAPDNAAILPSNEQNLSPQKTSKSAVPAEAATWPRTSNQS